MPKKFDPLDIIRQFLEEPFWIPTIETDTTYFRLHDDHDGTFEGVLRVIFDRMGDAYLSTGSGKDIRFRTYGGGGMSLRTRAALLILAEAIRLDNEDRPIDMPKIAWEIKKCACGKVLSDDPTENKEIEGKAVCDDCYSKVMDSEIEQHGVVGPGHRGPGGAH